MPSFGLSAPAPRVGAAHRRRCVAVACSIVSVLGGAFGAAAGATSTTPAHVTPRITELALAGHGDGAGLGMGQWGDFGYAVRYHRTYLWILNHFYGGTTIAFLPAIGQSANPTVSVAIMENENATSGVGYDPVVTSAEAFSFTSAVAQPSSTPTTVTPTTVTPTTVATSTTVAPPTTAPTPTTVVPPTTPSTATTSTVSATAPTSTTVPIVIPPLPTTAGPTFNVPAGEAVDLALQPDGTWNAYVGASCTGATAAKAMSRPLATGLVDPVVSPGAPSAAVAEPLLSLCRHDGVDEPMQGAIQAFNHAGYARTLNLVSLQSYLEGVVPAEESASWGDDGGAVGAPQGEAWGFQALEVQAIAARSYLLASVAAGGWLGFADICDSTACQAYVGSSYQSSISNLAVADTSGVVLVAAGTRNVALARYSASTGGWSATGEFPAVRDFGDDCVVPGNALECNPSHDWQVTLTGAAITRKFRAVGRLQRVRVIERNGRGAYGGRVLEVLIKGQKEAITVTGDEFAIALNLPSAWFAIAATKRA
jgi:SpoIID/LytB domain protein